MNKFHVQKGDEVLVITGSQKGRKGKILEVRTDSHRILIEGLNMMKKHVRPTQENPKGGVMERESSIHISNVKLLSRPTAAPSKDKKKSKEKSTKAGK